MASLYFIETKNFVKKSKEIVCLNICPVYVSRVIFQYYFCEKMYRSQREVFLDQNFILIFMMKWSVFGHALNGRLGFFPVTVFIFLFHLQHARISEIHKYDF